MMLTLITAVMIAAILGVTVWALILDRPYRRLSRTAADAAIAADAVKHRKRVAEIAREHDRVTLAPGEKRLFAEIAGQFGAACMCGHSEEAHEHHRTGGECSGCECRRYRRRAPNATRRTA